jgi:hypothetical protein
MPRTPATSALTAAPTTWVTEAQARLGELMAYVERAVAYCAEIDRILAASR